MDGNTLKKYQVVSNSSNGVYHYYHGIFDTEEEASAEVDRLEEEGSVWNCWYVDIYI